MKKFLLALTMVLLPFLLLQCNKRKGVAEEKDKPSVAPVEFIPIEIDMGGRVNYDIDSVYATIVTPATKSKNLILARAAYNNNKFTILLPVNIGEEHLLDAESILLNNAVEIGEPDHSKLKLSNNIRFVAYKNKSQLGKLNYSDTDCEFYCQILYYYSNMPCEIKIDNIENHQEYMINIHFHKGVNKIYKSFSYKNPPPAWKLTSEIPPDAKWYFWHKDSISY